MHALIISFYQTTPFNVIITPKNNKVQFYKTTFKNGSPDKSELFIIPI